MKVLLATTLCLFALAAQPLAAMTPQQERMKHCNVEAKEKNVAGKEERQKFMSECLKAKPADGRTAQQDKMKTCNAEAKEKKVTGKEERQKFMSECLKK